MNYIKLTTDTWKQLDLTGNALLGYKSIWLGINDNEDSGLHIFRDESGQYHFVIEVIAEAKRNDLEDADVNGLDIISKQYRLVGKAAKFFIDIRCSISAYLEEFTEVVKEISKNILEKKKSPTESVNIVIRNWKKFWANQSKEILSENDQIGLICEISILELLIKINPVNALNSWTGPLGQKHDFNFSVWNFEVKGTRSNNHTHTINGIDQLRPSDKKSLAFISFLVSNSNNDNAISLQGIIEKIREFTLQTRPDLIIRFNELLAGAGYSPIYSEEYRKFKIDILDAVLYKVDNLFPRLISESLIEPLSNRITAVRYDLFLDGLSGKRLNEINWGNYFY